MLLGFCVIFRTVRLLAVVLLIGLYDPLGDGFGVGFFVLVQQLVVLLVVDEPQLDEDAGHLGLAQDVVAGDVYKSQGWLGLRRPPRGLALFYRNQQTLC